MMKYIRTENTSFVIHFCYQFNTHFIISITCVSVIVLIVKLMVFRSVHTERSVFVRCIPRVRYQNYSKNYNSLTPWEIINALILVCCITCLKTIYSQFSDILIQPGIIAANLAIHSISYVYFLNIQGSKKV